MWCEADRALGFGFAEASQNRNMSIVHGTKMDAIMVSVNVIFTKRIYTS